MERRFLPERKREREREKRHVSRLTYKKIIKITKNKKQIRETYIDILDMETPYILLGMRKIAR